MNTAGATHKQEGHKLATGRIRNFDKAGLTVDELDEKVNEYFSQSTIIPEESQFVYFNQGKSIAIEPGNRIFTFPGLCYFLGFDSREGYRKAMKDTKNPFSTVLKKAYIRMQSYFESMAVRNGNPAGPMFILKNMDYSDQQTINQNVTEIKAPEIVTADKESATELRRLMKKAV